MAAAQTARRAPARRPARRRSAPAPIRWDRISRYGLLIVFVGLMVLYVNPLRNYVDTLQESKARQAEVAGLEREHKALEARKRALGRPGVIEAHARRLGMVRPGERPFVVRNLPR